MTRNIVVITWTDESKAYQALSDLRSTNEERINQAGVVRHNLDGTLELMDSDSRNADMATLSGGLIGGLVGILGGPLGLLLGMTGGALVGALVDADDDDDEELIVARITEKLLPGTTALLIDVDESDTSLIDTLALTSGGSMVRFDYDDALTEVTAAQQAAATTA